HGGVGGVSGEKNRLRSSRIGEQDGFISGSLRLMDKDGDVLVEFKAVEDAVDPSSILCPGKDSSSVVEWKCNERPSRPLESQLSCETEWDMVNAVYFRKKSSTPQPQHVNYRRPLSFSVMDLMSVKVRKEGWMYLIFILKNDSTIPALHFHHGGGEAFLDCLRRHVLLSESVFDHSCLMVSRPNSALSQSFENLLDDTTFGLIQKFRKDPYTTTLGGFSKVTNYLFDAFRGPDAEPQERPPDEVADMLTEAIPGLDINQQEEPGFEVITRVDLGERPEVQRSEPVTQEEWEASVDSEGRIRDPQHLKNRIFRGGLCHSLRREVWKFLLGFYPWSSTQEARRVLHRSKTDEYFRMKLQWKSVSEEQEKRNSRLRDYRSLIEKDVNRTDRTNSFYEGEGNPGLILLHDVLMTYCMYDFDLGYVQGMSDLLSPILYVMENEVDAFWCFTSFMDEMHKNFEEQMQGMKTQLIQLGTLLRLLDRTFWNYLESQDSGYLYFCFRWLLIRFKRELTFLDVLRLWEVMWTGLPCQNFHLLMCCAILDSEKQKIMDERYGFNEILKHVNELAMKLHVEEILCQAEALCLQLKNCKDLPSSIAEILGFSCEASAAVEVDDGKERDSPEPFSPSQVLQSAPSFSPSRNGHIRNGAPDLYKLAYIS
uniref:TBC1 domain family member 15 n=1 Tax=Denticeps clupeoides TaxID=299321 RepID=A0AAY4BKC9_9TELE